MSLTWHYYVILIILEWDGDFTLCRHLRPYSGQEHTVFILIQSGGGGGGGGDDKRKKGKETEKKKTTGRLVRHAWGTADLSIPAPDHFVELTTLTPIQYSVTGQAKVLLCPTMSV